MDGRKKVVASPSLSSSTSSLPSELFGSRENSSSSPTGYFEWILSPSSKASGRGSLRPDSWKKPTDSWNDKFASTGDNNRGWDRENPDSGFYQEQRVSQPCHLSSSIYYGGQDVYSQPKDNPSSSTNFTYKKDVGEDDGCASRGNWWQGSLYY